MNFASFLYKGNRDYGVLNNNKTKVIPMKILLNELNKEIPNNLLEFIEMYSSNLITDINYTISLNNHKGIPLKDVRLIAPIPNPRRNIFCLGKNYVDHAKEIKHVLKDTIDIPPFPIYFSKIADPAIGHLDTVLIPTNLMTTLDYEVELAIIIARDGKDISPEKVEDYIFGYTIANDITSRHIQTKHVQWFKSKSLDTFAPMGPYIVHKSEIEYPPKLDITCKVNDEIRQNFNTEKLIFDISYIISDLSKGLTLRAGDIILTGTPAGVGVGFNPPKFLQHGDIIECTIDKIGVLVNYIE